MLCEGKENMNIVEGEEIGRGEENFWKGLMALAREGRIH